MRRMRKQNKTTQRHGDQHNTEIDMTGSWERKEKEKTPNTPKYLTNKNKKPNKTSNSLLNTTHINKPPKQILKKSKHNREKSVKKPQKPRPDDV